MNTFFAGVSKDSNRVVSSSKTSWKPISPNNFFRIKGEPNFYEISKVNEFCYLKEAEVINGDTLKINEDIGANLLIGDELLVMFTVHEFVTVFKISSGGNGYRVGDIIKLDITNATVDNISGNENYTSFEITEVDHSGAIVRFSIVKKGVYYSEQISDCKVIGGKGHGASLVCLFQPKISQNTFERDVLFIERNIPSLIRLQSSIPKEIAKVNISCQKWEMLLSAQFNREIYDSQYEIIKDFTPNYHLPLLLQGSFSKELVFNRTITLIDQKLKELDDKTAKLERLLSLKSLE